MGVEAFAGFAQFVDDHRVRQAVIEHAVDLLSECEGQAGDFAAAAAGGLAGLELTGEVILGGIEEKGAHKGIVELLN